MATKKTATPTAAPVKKVAAQKTVVKKTATLVPDAIVTVIQTGAVKEISFTEGMTVMEAFEAAGVSGDSLTRSGNQVRLNNNVITDPDTELAENDQLVLVGNIAGGQR